MAQEVNKNLDEIKENYKLYVKTLADIMDKKLIAKKIGKNE